MFYKIAIATLIISMPLTAYAAKVVTPNAIDRNSSSIKFQPNPQTLAINDLQDEVATLRMRVDKLEQAMVQANENIETIKEAMYLIDQKINGNKQGISNNTAILQEIINCGNNGKTFNGSSCVRPYEQRR